MSGFRKTDFTAHHIFGALQKYFSCFFRVAFSTSLYHRAGVELQEPVIKIRDNGDGGNDDNDDHTAVHLRD